MDPLLQRVLGIADEQVGVRETSKNRGPQVDEYIRAARLDPAVASYPWCVAMIQWIFREAARDLNIETPLPRTASVLGLWQTAEKRLRHGDPEEGDIFLIDHGRGRGHAGLVELVMEKWVVTIEGNSNPKGSREGDGVYRRTRNFDEINLGYLRFAGYADRKGLVA